jgi:aryl-alcohol dehydrogenase-like predicted oxidoreductase
MKLGLGTAQFGLSYGVTNVGGQVPAARAQTMIRCAFEQGIELFDTAPDYGTAEKVLGSVQLPGAAKIVTKIGRLGRNSFGPRAISQIRTRFRDSLARLHRPDVYGVLLHAPDDLRLPGADLLIEMLHDLRDRGMVRRVGISAYRREQIDYCLRRFSLDLFQVPVSYLDQRLVRSGLLGDILKSGAEIHARSAFLQGSLLVEPDALPGYFEPWR